MYMKKTESFFSVLFVLVDYGLLVLAGVSAYYFRFSAWSTKHWPIIFNLPFSAYFNLLLLVSLLWIVVFFLAGVYKISNSRPLAQELQKIFLASATSFALVAVIIFFKR